MISPHAHWLMFGASSPDESILELVDDGSVDLIAEVLHSALSIGRLKNDRLFIVGELALGLCIDSNQLVMRGDGNTMGDLGDDLQLFNRDLVNFVQQVDARNVVPVPLHHVDEIIDSCVAAQGDISVGYPE